jgi:hypothetical protein
MTAKTLCGLVVFLLLMTAAASSADTTFFAFRGSANQCKSYMIFHAGWLERVDQSGPSPKKTFLIPFDFGLMKNISPKIAIGGSFHIACDDDFSRIGVRPRLHLWTGTRSGYDFSVGPLLSSGEGKRGKIKSPGWVAQISFSIAELLSLDVYYETYRFQFGGDHSGLYVGATGRSYFAFFIPILAILASAGSSSSFQ